MREYYNSILEIEARKMSNDDEKYMTTKTKRNLFGGTYLISRLGK